MISNLQDYTQQLHPAFAGYIFDGEVSDNDALAVIFHLIKKGNIEPEFKDNHILHGIEFLRRNQRKPQYPFEQQIIDVIFSNSNRIKASEIGSFIKNNTIQKIIKNNVQSITDLPLIHNNLSFEYKGSTVKFEINGRPVNSIAEAKKFSKTLKHFLIPLFTILGITFLSIGISQNIVPLILNGAIFTFLPLLMLFIFQNSTHKIDYQFEDKVIPLAKQYYQQTLQLLQKFPPKHDFTYEYIPYAIAFGINTSWHQNFGLTNNDFRIDQSPIKSPSI